MHVRFADRDLERVEEDADFTAGFSPALVKLFRRRMQQIRVAPDERVFYELKSLHFEKLKGDRRHERSMMLNKQYRLILVIEGKGENKTVLIKGIEDYH